jgi:hypothetical protein
MMGQCFECNKQTKYIHFHHVVPKCLGGTRTVPLCDKCHGLVHDHNFTHRKNLQKKGIEKAKVDGKYTGRKQGCYKHSHEEIKKIVAERDNGLSIRKISIKYGLGTATVSRYMKDFYHTGLYKT